MNLNPHHDLFAAAGDFAKAHNVPLTVAAEAVLAERKLEELSNDHHKANPALTPEQAMAAVLDTSEGADLYAKMHPRSKPKAVKADPQALYAARWGLRCALAPRLAVAFDDAGEPTGRDKAFAERVGHDLSKVTETQIVDTALHLLTSWLERQPEGKTGIDWFDE